MASGIVLHIQEELTCPICLGLLTEPLSLECGHSFCKACITADNKEPVIAQKEERLCPVCRFSYHPGDLRPNRTVANIVERLREVKVSPEEGQKRDLCVRHGEKLQLFCKEDGKVICWLCERSQEHRGHHTLLMEEVAQEYQKKLGAALERLKREQKKTEMYKNYIRKEGASWKTQIQNEIQSFQNCIKRLKDILDIEEQKELQKLKKTEENVLRTLAESEEELVQQSKLVSDLMSALEHRLQGSAIGMVQEKLQETLKKLTDEEQEAEKLEANISEERAAWKHCMQTERQKILKGFEEMRGVLDREERKELQKLEEDEVNVLDNLAAAKDQVAQQRQYMSELILDLQRQIWGSSLDTLQDVINVIKRSESWTWKKPKIVSKKLKSAFRAPDLTRVLQEFKELTEVQSYWVDFRLNPVIPLSDVVISEDHRQVTAKTCFMFRNVYPSKFSAFDVLGCQNFSSGKYYWEVDVSRKLAWILGVYSNTSDLNKKKSSGFVFNPPVNHQTVYSRFRPGNGYWVVGLNESEYNAFEDSSTSEPKVLTLSMAVPPCRVGVFLDYEAGTVSFFNVTNHGSLIYKFSKCRFSQTAYPYFNPGNCPAPMTLCQPNS